MTNRDRIRERYLKDALPVRLAGLAADLSRVASSARRATGAAAAAAMLEESQYLIEWTAAEAPADLAEELVNVQVMLALWRQAWPDAQHHPLQRSLLAVQAKQWADQIMRHCENLRSGSGLTELEQPQ